MHCVSLRSLTGQVYETCNGFKTMSCLSFQAPAWWHTQIFSYFQRPCTAFPGTSLPAKWHFGGTPRGCGHPALAGVDSQPLAPCGQSYIALSRSRWQPWDPTPHTHTLVGRGEQAHVGLFLFWLSPDTGWRFSLGNWWQSQRKSSFLLCNLEKSNLSSKVTPSVERLCEICTNGCVRGKGLTAKLPALYWSFEFRSWVLCTLWWKKGKMFFHENYLLYSDLLTWVKANLNMTSIYCTIRKTEVMYYADFFNEKDAFIVSVSALENLHRLWKLPSRNDGSVVLLTLQLLFLWRFLTWEEAYKQCCEHQEIIVFT